LRDLQFQFLDHYRIAPALFTIESLDQKEIEKLSQDHGFSLPNDHKLLDLIKIPFYLNEYLRLNGGGEKMNYLAFKESLWTKMVTSGKPRREQCFLQIALQRASKGEFHVIPDCESDVLDNELKKD
jgi:hypothetical protein